MFLHNFVLIAQQVLVLFILIAVGFACGKAGNVRVGTGTGNARIEHLAHGVHLRQILFDHAAGLRHVTGVPLDVQFFAPRLLHQ